MASIVRSTCIIALVLFCVRAQSPYPQDPADIPHDFVCAWRSFAAEYTAFLRPDAVDEALAALQLPTLCNSSAPPSSASRQSSPLASGVRAHSSADSAVYVDGVNGNDANPGTIEAPLRSIGAGVAMARTRPPPATVLLRAATYYLPVTLDLTTEVGIAKPAAGAAEQSLPALVQKPPPPPAACAPGLWPHPRELQWRGGVGQRSGAHRGPDRLGALRRHERLARGGAPRCFVLAGAGS